MIIIHLLKSMHFQLMTIQVKHSNNRPIEKHFYTSVHTSISVFNINLWRDILEQALAFTHHLHITGSIPSLQGSKQTMISGKNEYMN